LTDLTRKTVEQTESRARDGAFVTGLYLQGARLSWSTGLLEESEPGEMFCALPVVCCRAVLQDKLDKSGFFHCPVYKTPQRGPTYVFTAQLRSKLPPAKWVLAGCCLVMETESD
jgi:dynein heavy chain